MIWNKLNKYPKPLRLSVVEGMFASLMFGGGMIFIVPFAVFLGANKIEIGLLSALPALFAAWFQLGSVRILEVYKNRKTPIMIMVFFQALSWLLIAAIPFIFPSNQMFWLILITTIGTLIGSAGGPLWQSWMRSLTPKEFLGEYFGMRNAISGTVVFLTMFACGLLLKIIEPSLTVYVFALIFLLSFIGRLLSTLIFGKIEDPPFEIDTDNKTHILTFINQLRKDNFGYFVLFGTLMTFAISLIGPFFSVYLLEGLGLKYDYFTYTLIISASAIASLISMSYWGKLIDKHGTIKVLRATGLLASIYPLALIFIRDPLGLTISETLSGIIFSGFNLCIANFIYESFEQKKIVKFASYQAALFGTATFFGIMLSGLVQMQQINLGIISSSFYFVCLAAVVIRLAVYTSLIKKIKEVRKTKPIKSDRLVMSVLTFEPVRETVLSNIAIIFLSTETSIKSATEKTIVLVEKVGKGGKKRIRKVVRRMENITVDGIETMGGATERGFEEIENVAVGGIDKIENITKKNVKKAGDIIRKRKQKGFF